MQLPSGFFEITISDVISLLLSALLVLLYWKISLIQSEQKQILKSHDEALTEQANAMSKQLRPDIRCQDVTAVGDTLYALLSNEGRGEADALQAKCALYAQRQQDGAEDSFEPASVETGDIVVNTHYAMAYSSGEPGSRYKGESSRKIQPKETSWFKADIKLYVDEDEIRPFSEVLRQLSTDWDAEQIAFDLYVGSLDALNRQHVTVVGSYRDIPLESMTLEAALEEGERSDPIHTFVEETTYPATKVFEQDR